MGGGGGGGGLCAVPPICAAGGPVRLGVALPRSVRLPSLGRQQSGCSGRSSSHGGDGPHIILIHARLLFSGAVRVAPWCVGSVPWSIVVPAGAGGWGVGAGPAPTFLPGAAVLPGGGSIPASASGGVAAGVLVACRSVGRWGDRGGVAPLPPSSRSGWGGLQPYAQPFTRCRHMPSRCMRSAGVVGQPRALGAACHRRASLAGRGGGSP